MKTLNEWAQERQMIRQTLWKLLGDLPTLPSEYIIENVIIDEKEHYIVENFILASETGDQIPAVFLRPKHIAPPYPVILYLHAHGHHYDIGKDEIFRPRAAGIVPADALTREGYAVFAIDAYAFGSKDPIGAEAEHMWFKRYLLEGRTLWGMMVRDDCVALDYLTKREDIDPTRIAAVGMSMGSTRAWWLAALDERVATTVAVACLSRYQDLIETHSLNEHSIYFYVPGILKHFDVEQIISLIAPRPLLCMNGDQDPTSPLSGIETATREISKTYAIYDKTNLFRNIIYPNTGHVFTETMWQEMIHWLNQHILSTRET